MFRELGDGHTSIGQCLYFSFIGILVHIIHWLLLSCVSDIHLIAYSFLRKIYTSAQECPRSYDKLRFDPR